MIILIYSSDWSSLPVERMTMPRNDFRSRCGLRHPCNRRSDIVLWSCSESRPGTPSRSGTVRSRPGGQGGPLLATGDDRCRAAINAVATVTCTTRTPVPVRKLLQSLIERGQMRPVTRPIRRGIYHWRRTEETGGRHRLGPQRGLCRGFRC